MYIQKWLNSIHSTQSFIAKSAVFFCTTECVVFWCINAPFYSLLFGYIKHQLKKYC